MSDSEDSRTQYRLVPLVIASPRQMWSAYERSLAELESLTDTGQRAIAMLKAANSRAQELRLCNTHSLSGYIEDCVQAQGEIDDQHVRDQGDDVARIFWRQIGIVAHGCRGTGGPLFLQLGADWAKENGVDCLSQLRTCLKMVHSAPRRHLYSIIGAVFAAVRLTDAMRALIDEIVPLVVHMRVLSIRWCYEGLERTDHGQPPPADASLGETITETRLRHATAKCHRLFCSLIAEIRRDSFFRLKSNEDNVDKQKKRRIE